jgi:hydroxymethylglutaryl-CoA lyase
LGIFPFDFQLLTFNCEGPHLSEIVEIVECPRDAWQGLTEIIPAKTKIEYLLSLVAAGIKHIDAVSFVSPKHVRQMADSEDVMKGFLAGLPAGMERPEIIGIVVNEQGMERALKTPGVTTLGYPYSISAYFRRANANMSRGESRAVVEKLRQGTKSSGHGLVVYISMAFGNPYEEPWGQEIVEEALVWLKDIGVRTVSLADTVGTAPAAYVGALYNAVKDCVAGVELGVHLHSRPEDAAAKVLAAYDAGCRRFDGALTGLGGCPFAGDALVGNIPTETVLSALAARGAETGIRPEALDPVIAMTQEIRAKYGHEARGQ